MPTLFDQAYKQKRTWLQKNIRPLIALVILGFTLLMICAILYVILASRINAEDKDVLFLLINCITGFATLVLGFYFGSMEKNGEAANPSGDFDDVEFPEIPNVCPHCGKSLMEHVGK